MAEQGRTGAVNATGPAGMTPYGDTWAWLRTTPHRPPPHGLPEPGLPTEPEAALLAPR